MTIEKSPTPAAHTKPAARADSSHAAKGKPADSAGAAEGTGFMAILGALGDGSGADSALPDPNAATLADLTDAPVLPDAPAVDASLLLQQNPQIAAAQWLQKAGASRATAAQQAQAPDAAALGSAAPGALPGAALPLTTPATTPSAEAATGLPPAALPVGATATDGALMRPAFMAGLAAQEQPQMLTQVPSQGLQQAGVRARLARDAQLGDTGSSAVSGASSAVGKSPVDASRLQAAQELARSPQIEQLLEPLLAPLLTKQDKPQSERAGFGLKAAEPTYLGSTLGVSLPDFSQSGAAAPVLAPEMQVAEQVSYWVSHNVQNAELSLDGLGQAPVQVSISVQGNEAQIVFRSDEAATRSLLEGAGSHLKDLLQREGLLLTDVSVGGSGNPGNAGNWGNSGNSASGEAGGGERRGRQNVRQGVIGPLQVTGLDGGIRLRADAGRAVDLFV
jgi:flagellar hook-length control protein FliK